MIWSYAPGERNRAARPGGPSAPVDEMVAASPPATLARAQPHRSSNGGRARGGSGRAPHCGCEAPRSRHLRSRATRLRDVVTSAVMYTDPPLPGRDLSVSWHRDAIAPALAMPALSRRFSAGRPQAAQWPFRTATTRRDLPETAPLTDRCQRPRRGPQAALHAPPTVPHSAGAGSTVDSRARRSTNEWRHQGSSRCVLHASQQPCWWWRA
jgi:hypothetical protein